MNEVAYKSNKSNNIQVKKTLHTSQIILQNENEMNEVALMQQSQIVLQYLAAGLNEEVRGNIGYQLEDLLKSCEFDQKTCGAS